MTKGKETIDLKHFIEELKKAILKMEGEKNNGKHRKNSLSVR